MLCPFIGGHMFNPRNILNHSFFFLMKPAPEFGWTGSLKLANSSMTKLGHVFLNVLEGGGLTLRILFLK